MSPFVMTFVALIFMKPNMLYRSFSLLSAWCVALCVLATTCVHAAEFKSFFTLRIDSPEAIFNIIDRASGLVDPSGTMGIETMVAPYKKLPGVKTNGMIGLAIQRNEISTIGIDPVLFLPISNLEQFMIPGQEEIVNQVKGLLQKEGTDKYLFTSPLGDFIAYQKKDYLVIAPVGAGDFANEADPKELFSALSKFTLGTVINLEQLSLEDIEAMLGNLAGLLAMQGMGEQVNMEEIFNAVKKVHEEFSSITNGVTIDERTLTVTSSEQAVPKAGSAAAEEVQNIKDVKTMFGGFLTGTAKTILSYTYIDYLTDSEIAELKSGMQLLLGSFAEGLSGTEEVTEEGTTEEGTAEEGTAEEGATQTNPLAAILFAWVQENIDHLAENKLIEAAFSLDSDGTLMIADATTEPDLILKIGSDLYNALPELIGAEQGEALRQLIASKIKLDYEAVAGFSLSCVPNLFAEIPEEIAIPARMKDLPINVFWAVKKNEAVAIAVGLDAVRTERALKNALGRTNTKVTPKQTAIFALKPLGEFVSRQVLPLMVKLGAEPTAIETVREFAPILASSESSAKVIVTTEFPDNAHLQQWQIDGKCFNVIPKLAAKQFELTMKRNALEQMKSQVQQQGAQGEPGTPPQPGTPAQQGTPEQPGTPVQPEGQVPPAQQGTPAAQPEPPVQQQQPAQDGEMQNPFNQ